jgi:hypothetical protein
MSELQLYGRSLVGRAETAETETETETETRTITAGREKPKNKDILARNAFIRQYRLV